jgi:mannose-6-phosphate isomerase-like protein (cupin superfamily)
LREIESGAELALSASHLAGAGFVVVSGEMKQTVKDEDFDFG